MCATTSRAALATPTAWQTPASGRTRRPPARELISSTSHSRATRSQGFRVSITFPSGQVVGRVQHLRVLPPEPAASEQPTEPLRLAVCQFYSSSLQPQGEVLRVNSRRLENAGAPRAVHVDMIDAVLVSATERGVASGGGDLLRLVAFDNCSRL